MRKIFLILLGLYLIIPLNLHAGILSTDLVQFIQTDLSREQFGANRLSAYYDLRDRQSHIQVSNTSSNTVTIHVQIFQHDRGCTELNFDDTLTAFDTVVYDLDNLIKNDGSPAPLNLADDSYGYVVVSDRALEPSPTSALGSLIGNFRIIDSADYEYRVNMLGVSAITPILTELDDITLQAFFNTVDNAMYADLVGYVYTYSLISDSATVDNYDPGIDFDIFTFDMSEEPLSCDRRNFACGNVMNYGINEDYPNSKGGPPICPGGGLANPDGGYVNFENGALGLPGVELGMTRPVFNYLIGINNNNGTGSMDTWIDPTLLPDIDTCMTMIRTDLNQISAELCCEAYSRELSQISAICTESE